jgi:hypothetical protein
VPLRRRRALLMDGLSASLRLAPPEAVTAAGAQDSAAGGGGSSSRKGGRGRKGVPDDGVLRRLLGLRKGRDLLARALALMCPPQVSRLGSLHVPAIGWRLWSLPQHLCILRACRRMSK